jgi:23S rRNA G2445 N2-methylase RlmL
LQLRRAAAAPCRQAPSRPPAAPRAQAWHDYERREWEAAVEEARAAARAWRGLAIGNDVHEGALRLAQASARTAGVGGSVKLHLGDCGAWAPAGGLVPTFVATNPPWGGRLLGDDGGGGGRGGGGRGGGGGGSREMEAAWSGLGEFLKGGCPGATAWVLSGAPELTRGLGMRSHKKRSVTVGGVKAAWLGYDVRGPGDGGPGGGGRDRRRGLGADWVRGFAGFAGPARDDAWGREAAGAFALARV